MTICKTQTTVIISEVIVFVKFNYHLIIMLTSIIDKKLKVISYVLIFSNCFLLKATL